MTLLSPRLQRFVSRVLSVLLLKYRTDPSHKAIWAPASCCELMSPLPPTRALALPLTPMTELKQTSEATVVPAVLPASELAQ